MINRFVQAPRSYPEIAIFPSLAAGYYLGSFSYKGLGLGAVTATLIVVVLIGQLGITISGPLRHLCGRRHSADDLGNGDGDASLLIATMRGTNCRFGLWGFCLI
jgi:hypothetical protein